jgi:hypothetical protein
MDSTLPKTNSARILRELLGSMKKIYAHSAVAILRDTQIAELRAETSRLFDLFEVFVLFFSILIKKQRSSKPTTSG